MLGQNLPADSGQSPAFQLIANLELHVVNNIDPQDPSLPVDIYERDILKVLKKGLRGVVTAQELLDDYKYTLECILKTSPFIKIGGQDDLIHVKKIIQALPQFLASLEKKGLLTKAPAKQPSAASNP